MTVGASTTAITQAVSDAVLAGLALVGALVALWWWFSRLSVRAVVDQERKLRVSLANRSREPRQVGELHAVCVRSRFFAWRNARAQRKAGIDPPVDVRAIVVATPAVSLPIDIKQGAGRVIWLQLEEKDLPSQHARKPELELREPEARELRISLRYGDGKKVRKRIRAIDAVLAKRA